jgi:hypothetical protein
MIIPGQFGFNCPSGFREEGTRNTPKISAPPSAIGKNSHEIPKKKLRPPSQLEKL